MELSVVTTGPGLVPLLERDDDLGAIEGRLAATAQGRGSVLTVEGPAGIGKTTLLRAASDRAREQGFTVLTARGGPLEREFPYAVVRGLFDPLGLANGDPALLGGAAALAARVVVGADHGDGIAREDVTFGTMHGLYWLTANVAARQPTVIVVDDCRWADTASLRFLAYLAARLDGLPVLVVLATRSGEPAGDPALLSELTAAGVEPPIRLTPLSPEASACLARAELSAGASDRFCQAVHAATGGNPLLLRTLLTSVAAEGREPTDEEAERVGALGGASVARLLARRFARLPAGAEGIARAVAILGGGASLGHAATLASLELEQAATAADALRSAEILTPRADLDFVHPIIRHAVEESMGPDERALAHARAVPVLAAAGAPPERLAAHLLHTHPRGDQTAVEILQTAARFAADRGAPESVAVYLRRALAEPPGTPTLARGMQHELGLALMAAGRDRAALPLFMEVVQGGLTPAERLRVALEAGRALGIAGYFAAASDTLRSALSDMDAEPTDVVRDLRRQVEAELLVNCWVVAAQVPDANARLAAYQDAAIQNAAYRGADVDEGLGHRLMRVNLAFRSIIAAEPAGVAAHLLDRALAGGALVTQESIVVTLGTVSLAFIGRYDAVEQICSRLIDEGERRGSASLVAHFSLPRGLAALRRGRLRDAEDDERCAFENKLAMGRHEGLPFATSWLVDALVLRGDLAGAEATLERACRAGMAEAASGTMGWAFALESRGRLRIAQGRASEGLRDLFEAGALWTDLRCDSPAVATWRGDAAVALAGLGDRDRARDLAEEQLVLARGTELPHVVGVATRVAAAVAPADRRLDLLAEAVATLEPTEARVDLARALVEFGAALRRAGQLTTARDTLRRGLDLAHHANAGPLAERAREELTAAGARPRRPALTGVDALTAGERRVALLAADGRSNREIAEKLFVTQRTVETHLQHAFGKLGIHRRDELAGVLSPDPEAGSGES